MAARAIRARPQTHLIDWTIQRIALHEHVGRNVSAWDVRHRWSYREIAEALVLCDELDLQADAAAAKR